MIQQQVDANQNLFLIMDSVGHTSPIVTQRYLRNSTSEGSKQASQIIQRDIESREALKAQLAQIDLEAQIKKDEIYAKMVHIPA